MVSAAASLPELEAEGVDSVDEADPAEDRLETMYQRQAR